VLTVDGVDPADLDALAQGKYTLYRTLNLVVWNDGKARKPLAEALLRYAVAEAERDGARYSILPAGRLRKAGWRFREDELIGEPGS